MCRGGGRVKLGDGELLETCREQWRRNGGGGNRGLAPPPINHLRIGGRPHNT